MNQGSRDFSRGHIFHSTGTAWGRIPVAYSGVLHLSPERDSFPVSLSRNPPPLLLQPMMKIVQTLWGYPFDRRDGRGLGARSQSTSKSGTSVTGVDYDWE